MTVEDDDVLAAVARLRTPDISARHALRLRRQCHALLQTQSRPKRLHRPAGRMPFRRVVVPALGGVWCVAYLVEIIRVAAAVYLGIP